MTPARLARLFLPGLLAVLVAVGPARPATADADPRLDDQWALDRIGAPAAWARGQGAGVVVAVVSTGVLATHEDLAANLLPGNNAIQPDNPPDDDGAGAEGTGLAGLVGAVRDNGLGIAGVAPLAKVLPVKALLANRRTSATTYNRERWLGAVDLACTQSKVVLLDLPSDVPTEADEVAEIERRLTGCWEQHGTIVVVPAGERGSPRLSLNATPVIQVTATTKGADDETDPKDRNQQATTAQDISAGWGLAAPGGSSFAGILSTNRGIDDAGGYGTTTGTAAAAAHVAGAAAVLRGIGFGLNPTQTVRRLLETAQDLGDAKLGSGLLDLAKAASLGGPPAPPTTAAATTTTKAKAPAKSNLPAGALPPGVVNPNASPSIPGAVPTNREPIEIPEPGEVESGTVPGQAEVTLEEAGGDRSAGRPFANEDRRPWSYLAVGLASLCLVCAGLSHTFRRLAADPSFAPLPEDALPPADPVPPAARASADPAGADPPELPSWDASGPDDDLFGPPPAAQADSPLMTSWGV